MINSTLLAVLEIFMFIEDNRMENGNYRNTHPHKSVALEEYEG
jgi:hypothetical protein